MKRNALFFLLLALTCSLIGCGPQVEQPRPTPPPPPPYSGPAFLQTSIGSMVAVGGYRPQFVSGFGLVTRLRHTGSPDCPPALRAWFLNEIAAKGFGRESLGFGDRSPTEVLASDTTAVVLVEAVIPPGAPAGSRFDVLVTALPGTSTTSLEGGVLYTTDLRINGADISQPSSEILATASGPMFLNPFSPANIDQSTGLLVSSTANQVAVNPTTARILSGGVVTTAPIIVLQLNQPSFLRSRQIADRINGRFPQMPGDPDPLAVPKTDQLIRLNVINAFTHDPRRMVELVNALFLNPTANFNHAKAIELRDLLAKPENHRYAPQIALVWQAMGKTQLPFLRDTYTHTDPVVKLTALEAGARLGDLQAADPLYQLATSDQSQKAELAVRLLGYILRDHPDNLRVSNMLRQFLNADDALVRLNAFDALANVGDPIIQARSFNDKFELDLVPSTKSMIYVTRTGRPRIVLFNPDMSFNHPAHFQNSDNSFMIRYAQDDQQLNVYYRPPDQVRGSTTQLLPLVANLVYLMANRPTEQNPTPGYDLSYSQVVNNLYLLSRAGCFDAPIVLQPSELIANIASSKQLAGPNAARPESSTDNTRPESQNPPSSSSPSSTPDAPKPIHWRDIPSENLNSPVAPKPDTSDNPKGN